MPTPRAVTAQGTLTNPNTVPISCRISLVSQLQTARGEAVLQTSTIRDELNLGAGLARLGDLPPHQYGAVYPGEVVAALVTVDLTAPVSRLGAWVGGQRQFREPGTALTRGVSYDRTYRGMTQPIEAVLPAGRAWQGANSRIWWWDGSQWVAATLFASPWRWEPGPGPGFSTLTQGQPYTLISEAADNLNYIGPEWS